MASASPLLLFYPTSPVHVRDMKRVLAHLPGWTCQAIVFRPFSRLAPGIAVALEQGGVASLEADENDALENLLPGRAEILLLGMVAEPFTLELFAWARLRGKPIAAIEEVAQLGLNCGRINNYYAPFDRLFVASPDEFERFLRLGYPPGMLRITGLPAYERIDAGETASPDAVLRKLGITDGRAPVVYTTSPRRFRLGIHNTDSVEFRNAVLAQLAVVRLQTGRRIVIKLHPNEDLEFERKQILQTVPDAIVIGREMAIDELLAATAVLINRGNSQTCLEAALRGVPAVVVACGLPTLFAEHGGAWVVDVPAELPAAVARSLAEGGRAAPEFHDRHCRLPANGVSAEIAREIELLAAEMPIAGSQSLDWLVRTILFLGKHQRALDLLRTLRSRTPWQTFVADALTFHFAGDRNAAMAEWRRCLDIDAEWFFPHYELAHGCLASGDWEAATAHAERAIALHPTFYDVWHELPMRVVIMAALRGLGRDVEAEAELAALEQRGLVDVVPELLIEKSAQATRRPQGLRLALDAVERALGELERFPIDPGIDKELQERALTQLHKVTTLAERASNHAVAAGCHARLATMFPDDAWERFAWARATLGEGHWAHGLRMLAAMSAIPEAPREVAARALPAQMTAELLPFWPGTPGVRSRPWRLLLRTAAWCLRSLRASPVHDWPHPLAFTLLVGLFVPRYFLHRLLARRPVIP